MTIKIFNTLSGKKEIFDPIDKNNIRMYVCGPTVYDFAHIGNARPVIVFDVLFRLLRLYYGENLVTYVRNITDIDDKIIKASNEKNISTTELTKQTTKNFHEDIKHLNVLKPSFEPKATETIKEMILMIEQLINKKLAYCAENHVLFNTKESEEYGKLSNRSKEDMLAGARVEVAPYKKNPYDFVLWKPSKDQEPGWESPWGFGRPGWHIECSAMVKKFLGISFDIHAGGADLIFPHHENEIAQSEGVHEKMFSKYWMHNGYLNIVGEKMSKSLGNIMTIRELLNEYDGEVLRFAMLSSHYRQPINFSKDLLDSSKKQLNRIYSCLDSNTSKDQFVNDSIPNSLLDDMNTPLAIAEIHDLVKKIKVNGSNKNENINKIKFYGKLMGILDSNPSEWLNKTQKKLTKSEIQEIENLINSRNLARQNSDFKLADEIREQLTKKGVILEDNLEKTNWKLLDGQ